MKRLLLVLLLVLAPCSWAFLSLSDPALVAAIDGRSGDVYLRLKDRRLAQGQVYRFRKTDTDRYPVGGGLFSIGNSSGIAVDKFARVTVLEEKGSGGRKSLSALSPAVGDGQLLAINKTTGERSVVDLGKPQKQATAPGGTAFQRPSGSFDYVPSPHTLKCNQHRTNVHADHGFSGWIANKSSTVYPDMLTGLNQWYVSDVQGRNAHGGLGPNLARAVSGWYESNEFIIKNWISAPDFNNFPVPGPPNGAANTLVGIGNPITSSLNTGYSLEYFSSCGDKCLASPGSASVSSTLKVPSKIVFSSQGLSAEQQRVYGIQSTGNAAVVLRYKLEGNVWKTEPVAAGDVVDSHSLRSSGTVQTFGVAAKLGGTDYIYKSELPSTEFSASGKFFQDGSTLYGYRRSAGTVEWEDRQEIFGQKITGKVTNLGSNVRAITSDGRGNLYYFVQEKNPPDAKITESFDAVNPSAVVPVPPLAPGPFNFTDTVLELPGGQQTEITELTETVVKSFKAPGKRNFACATGGSCFNSGQVDTFDATTTKSITKRTVNPDNSVTNETRAESGTEKVSLTATVSAPTTASYDVKLQFSEATGGKSITLPSVPGGTAGAQVCSPSPQISSDAPQVLPPVVSVAPEKSSTITVVITVTREISGCVVNTQAGAGGGNDMVFDSDITYKTTTVTKTTTKTTYKGTLARKVYFRQTQQFSLRAINVFEADSSRVTDARLKSAERGGLILDSQVWTRTAYKTPTDGALKFKASEPPIVDSGFTGGVVDYDLDADAIKLTDPPLTKMKAARIDVKPMFGDPLERIYEENFEAPFLMENAPVWNGVFAGQFGQMNSNWVGAGLPGATNNDDGDGVRGFVGDTFTRNSFKWRWIVRALSEPQKSAYHNGRRATTPSQSNNGIVYQKNTSKTYADSDGFSDASWRDIAGTGLSISVENQAIVAFNFAGSPDKYKFKDPGEYEIELQIAGEYFDTSGLTFANSANDVKKGQYGPDLQRSRTDSSYIYVEPRKESIRIEAEVPLEDQYVWNIEHKGPANVDEDNTIQTNKNNWYAEAYVRFYSGINYEYYKNGLPPDADMKKHHGVGKYIYPQVDQTKLTPQDWIAIRDGVSDYGTRVDSIRRGDFENITYQWYLKVTDPNKPAELVPAGLGALIASGNLSEIWDLNDPSMYSSELRASITRDGISQFIEALPESDGTPTRRYRVRIPLLAKEVAAVLETSAGNRAQAELGDRKRTYLLTTAGSRTTLPDPLRVSFDVPTEPTAIQLACRISFPKVRWVDVTQSGQRPRVIGGKTIYYDLVDNPGSWFGLYKKSSNSSVVPKWVHADPKVEDSDDYVETYIIDVTKPWVSAQGNSKTFDPQKYGSVQRTSFTTPEHVETGKALPLGTADNLYRVFVVDNNPYQHFTAWNGGATDPKQPILEKFHYEVGEDLRVRDSSAGGVGLKTQGCYFGFDISHTGNKFNLVASDFASDPIGNKLPTRGDYVYGSDRIKQWVDGAGKPVFSYGVLFDSITGVSAPAFNPTSSQSRITADLGTWARTDHTTIDETKAQENAGKNYRVTQWEFKDNELPMPIFVENSKNEPSIFAKVAAEGSDRTFALPGIPARNHKSDPTQVGGIQVFDVDPPNLMIELVEFKGATPVHFVASKDYYRSWAASPVDIAGNWQTFKASADARPVYKTDSTRVPRPGVVFGAGSARMNQTTEMDLSASPGWAPGSAFDYWIEEDVRFKITVRAADNGSDAANIALSIEGVEGTAQRHFPKATKVKGEVGINTGGAAALMATHFYPSAGETDRIHITAEDLAGKRRELVLNLTVTQHETNYRVIGNTNRNVGR